jgi:hypothetical protein
VQVGTVWHRFSRGTDNGPLVGYHFGGFGGSNLWYHFTAGVRGEPFHGYAQNVTGDGTWHKFDHGIDLGIVDGVNCEVFVDGSCGDVMRAVWPGNGVVPDQPDSEGNLPPCGPCHLFRDGRDLGPIHGYFSVMGSWSKFSNGTFIGLVTGCHEDNVMGDSMSHCFDSGGYLIENNPNNNYRPQGIYVDNGLWYYYDGFQEMGQGTLLDGELYNLSGDGLNHSYSQGVDNGPVE